MSYVGPPHRMSSAHHVSFMYIRGIHLQLFHTQLSLFILQAILTPPTPLAGPYFTMDFYPVHGSVLEGVCSAVSIFSELLRYSLVPHKLSVDPHFFWSYP